jgi:Restriction endonuclease XhoI
MSVHPILPANLEKKTQDAIAAYWQTLRAQKSKQTRSDADRGRRADVTGGKQMDAMCELVREVLEANGVPSEAIHDRGKLELPGYFRPTKKWDMLVIHEEVLLAAIEFKSQVTSVGNNFNNRVEEAIGVAVDFASAARVMALGGRAGRPWLGWMMMIDVRDATTPSRITQPHYEVLNEYIGTSYAMRYELAFKKLCKDKLVDGAALLLVDETKAEQGAYQEPASELSMHAFLSSLVIAVVGKMRGGQSGS